MLLPVYIGLFMIFAIASIADSVKEGEPRWVVVVDFLSSVAATAGLVAFWRDWNAPGLVAAWQVVAPLLVAAYVVTGVWEAKDIARRREADLSERETRWVVRVGIVLAIVFVVPALWLNLQLAYGR